INTDAGRALLDMIVTQQASMIAYINDYKLLMILTLGMIPMVMIISTSRKKPGEGETEEAAVLE
ncbi:MAG TPA: EmrB/QacA family drug resistance transporter, partial [Pseudolabrys sp.]|nr:EmrB/QacA family drug resistance transporter [Pseudolabrys sp.]